MKLKKKQLLIGVRTTWFCQVLVVTLYMQQIVLCSECFLLSYSKLELTRSLGVPLKVFWVKCFFLGWAGDSV